MILLKSFFNLKLSDSEKLNLLYKKHRINICDINSKKEFLKNEINSVLVKKNLSLKECISYILKNKEIIDTIWPTTDNMIEEKIYFRIINI